MPGRTRHRWAALLAGTIGYILLSIRQPIEWSIPLWAMLAFGVIPVLIGALGQARRGTSGFRAGFRPAAFLMAFYTACNLIVIQVRKGSGGDAGSAFPAGLMVVLTFALIAGIVGGMVGAARERATRRTTFGEKSA